MWPKVMGGEYPKGTYSAGIHTYSQTPSSASITPYSRGELSLSGPPASVFHAIDCMERSQVLSFVSMILQRVCAMNERVKNREHDDALTFASNVFSRGAVDAAFEDQIREVVDKLGDQSFVVRNLTFLLALVYMDRAAEQLLLFINGDNVVKVFGSCLILASKMHSNEVSREGLATCLGISIQELLAAESFLAENIRDLTIHPAAMSLYMRPLFPNGM